MYVCVQLADRWQAPRSIDAYKDKLVSSPFTAHVTRAVLNLPPGLRASSVFADAVDIAQLWLLDDLCSSDSQSARSSQPMLLDAGAFVTFGTMQTAFATLEHAQLLQLLRSPALAVDSKNTVLSLVVFWLLHRPLSPSAHEKQIKTLIAHVRLSHVSPTYLVDIVCNLSRMIVCQGDQLQLLRF